MKVKCNRQAILGTVAALLFGSLLTAASQTAPAQAADETLQNASGREAAIDVDKIRAQLANSRKAATAEAQAGGQAPGGVPLIGSDLENEQRRLLAAESELLNRLNQRAAGGKEADISGAGETAPEVSKASLDLDKAIQELSADKKRADGQIEVVKEAKPQGAAAQKVYRGEETSAVNKLIGQQGAGLETEQSKVAALESTNATLRRQLNASQYRLNQVSRELDETRNRLIIAETEVERLSKIIEERNFATLARYGSTARPAPLRQYQAPPAQQEKMSPDMAIATVVTDKAHLRTGPGKDNSPLMAVSRGTRLAVETRRGEWYRVIAPTGARAWVSADVVAFGPSADSSPTRIIKIKGYDASIEDEASRLVRQSQD